MKSEDLCLNVFSLSPHTMPHPLKGFVRTVTLWNTSLNVREHNDFRTDTVFESTDRNRCLWILGLLLITSSVRAKVRPSQQGSSKHRNILAGATFLGRIILRPPFSPLPVI